MRIGVFGVGHLGKIHLKCLKETDWDIIGLYDPDIEVAKKVSESFGIKSYQNPLDLIKDVDAIDIVSTTISHHEIALQAIEYGKHIFIEKPMASTVTLAKKIVDASIGKNLKIQIGHVERYNPVMKDIIKRGITPKFIEGHRLTTFNSRGNDVSVVYDLMIHDLDLVLSMVDSPINKVDANGVCVVNDTPDICNARITFENGAVANLTASRISMKNMRKIRVFQDNEYLSLDLIKKESQVISLTPADEKSDGLTILTSSGKKLINVEIPEHKNSNAIVDELQDFYLSVSQDLPVSVPAIAGLAAMQLAERVDKAIKNQGI